MRQASKLRRQYSANWPGTTNPGISDTRLIAIGTAAAAAALVEPGGDVRAKDILRGLEWLLSDSSRDA